MELILFSIVLIIIINSLSLFARFRCVRLSPSFRVGSELNRVVNGWGILQNVFRYERRSAHLSCRWCDWSLGSPSAQCWLGYCGATGRLLWIALSCHSSTAWPQPHWLSETTVRPEQRLRPRWSSRQSPTSHRPRPPRDWWWSRLTTSHRPTVELRSRWPASRGWSPRPWRRSLWIDGRVRLKSSGVDV